MTDPHTIDRLYYAAGTSGKRRRLHIDADCPGLVDATTVHDCPVTHPPRGSMCARCAPDLTLVDIERAHATATDGRRDPAGGPATPPQDYAPPRGERVRQRRGVGDQGPGCIHAEGALPCADCFLGGSSDDE